MMAENMMDENMMAENMMAENKLGSHVDTEQDRWERDSNDIK